jgi:hypothetical protein
MSTQGMTLPDALATEFDMPTLIELGVSAGVRVERVDREPIANVQQLARLLVETSVAEDLLKALYDRCQAHRPHIQWSRLPVYAPIESVTQPGRGAVIHGDVRVEQGDFVARDKITHQYQVADIPAPRPARPPDVKGFVGRAHELAQFAESLERQHIAVIAGMAGVGKTALAAALLKRTANPEDIFWHSFREGEGVISIAYALAGFLAWRGNSDLWRMLETSRKAGAAPPPAETLIDYVIQTLRGQQCVICLDDLHHVEDDPQTLGLVERLRAAIVASHFSLVIT